MSNSMQIPDSLSSAEMSIAVICPDEQRRAAATTMLRDSQSGPVHEFNAYPPDLNEVPRLLGDKYDVILVELDSDPEYALDLIEMICARNLATVMVYSAQTDPGLLLRCMRAGAREFLTLPFDSGTVAEALVRASVLRAGTRAPRKKDGKLLVFLGAKGGSGVTTLACNFASSLAKESGQRTLLIDFNLPLGDAAISLGVRPQYSISSAFQNTSRLDVNFLSTLLVQHESGLFVLAAPGELAPTYVSAEAIDKLLEVARQGFDYVVVDAGSRLDLQREHLFDESATFYLVTQVGIPELRNSHRLIALLSAAGSPRLEIVINRYDPRAVEIDEEHITKALTRPAKWKIPNNYAAVRRMQNTATLFTENDGQIAKVIQEMAYAVCGEPAVVEKKKRGFSLFRRGVAS
ncbi:MAG: AAA family ATPase [Terracidiphilus sp.]